jgi:DNA-binding response OmpR family regulator
MAHAAAEAASPSLRLYPQGDGLRLLLVEDERRLGALMQASLRDAGFAVDLAGTLADARMCMGNGVFDAVLIDRGLPDGDGLDLVRFLRAGAVQTPAIMLTAKDTVADRVAGLEAGADDYLVKPFATEEMIARVRALLRRPGAALGRVLSLGNVAFDSAERRVTVAGADLPLPRHELAALECFLRRAGRVVTKETLIEQLYGADDEPASNAVPVHIHNLRRKLEEAGGTPVIVTMRGLGYLMRGAER